MCLSPAVRKLFTRPKSVFDILPEDVWKVVLEQIQDEDDLCEVAVVCRGFYKLTQNEKLWKQFKNKFSSRIEYLEWKKAKQFADEEQKRKMEHDLRYYRLTYGATEWKVPLSDMLVCSTVAGTFLGILLELNYAKIFPIVEKAHSLFTSQYTIPHGVKNMPSGKRVAIYGTLVGLHAVLNWSISILIDIQKPRKVISTFQSNSLSKRERRETLYRLARASVLASCIGTSMIILVLPIFNDL